jgi:UDP-glucose:(glucosyl)LPS alpha-1,2-glucosyltransferase
MGGTELAKERLLERLPKELLDRFQIIARPIDELDPDRMRVLWIQDMPGDMPFLADPKIRSEFDKIVFVSAWQQTVFNLNMGISLDESVVIRNAIVPIKSPSSTYDDTVRLVYHPTPHRGLEILVPVFEELCREHDDLHLDVFSSFAIYAREELDASLQPLYDRCRAHPNITYHGSRSNDEVRAALASAHVFAYPSIWRETSCMSAMEAMSARCITVAPDYGALPETLANFHYRYDWDSSPRVHAARFKESLTKAIEDVRSGAAEDLLDLQQTYANRFYSWDTRVDEWKKFLSELTPRQRRKGGFEWI